MPRRSRKIVNWKLEKLVKKYLKRKVMFLNEFCDAIDNDNIFDINKHRSSFYCRTSNVYDTDIMIINHLDKRFLFVDNEYYYIPEITYRNLLIDYLHNDESRAGKLDPFDPEPLIKDDTIEYGDFIFNKEVVEENLLFCLNKKLSKSKLIYYTTEHPYKFFVGFC